MRQTTWMTVLLFAGLCAAAESEKFVLVSGGKAAATIVVAPAGEAGGRRRRGRFEATDAGAADVLADWVEKITGARLPVAPEAPAGGRAVLIGAAAVKAGLKLDAIDSPTKEGLRIVCDARRLLIAGQSGPACVKGVCLLLEKLGCRYFMDHPLGEVYPRTKDLSIGPLDITRKPGLLYRSIWGSQWSGQSLWKVWNGAGGLRMGMGHAWGQYVDKKLFDEHPEYFALRDGKRKKGDWYCTSNADLRKVFARGVIRAIGAGRANPSLSPPDGTGYCQCPACRKQDDAKSVEPSSGRVSVSNRYLDFLDHVAREVAAVHPESILSFYCYADYTQAPTAARKASPNLCAWIAPIRYSRYHRLGSACSPTRRQLMDLLDGWAKVVSKMGYRTYNYNLAECLVPFSKLSIWKHDIPHLKRIGCIGVNLETLANWEIYGPHIYQSIRLAYDPAADSDAMMDDYFLTFYGPRAGPLMKEYWLAIDRAFAEMKCETGSFFALHEAYTPQVVARLGRLVDQAVGAAKDDKACAARVAMAVEGFGNVVQYLQVRTAMNRGDFAAAKRAFDALYVRNEVEQKKRLGNHYTLRYLKRFLGKGVEAGAKATAKPNRMLAVLPDTWRLAYDADGAGQKKGYHKADFDDSAWKAVATYSRSLNAQGLPDRKTFMWYRTPFDVPRTASRLTLFFTEVDCGGATVYVNGKQVADLPAKQARRVPFEVEITAAARPGRNVVAVRADHSRISELFLGGIIRPVLLIAKPAGPLKGPAG